MIDDAGLDEVVTLVRAAARAEIMPRFRRLGRGEVQQKAGPNDLVTVADEAAEAMLTEGLHHRFPGCTVVGEEAATRDPALLDQVAAAPLCFVVDPIDGTYNYAHGVPLFGTMVAAVCGGRTVAAVIHDPVGDDWVRAAAGQGAWQCDATGRAERLHVAAPGPLHEMAGTVSWKYFSEPRRTRLCTRLPRLGWAWDMRCAAHQYRLLASGGCAFAIYNRTLPWDHAAGVLLHQEAGGVARRLDGAEYAPSGRDGGLLCAPDDLTWLTLQKALFGDEP